MMIKRVKFYINSLLGWWVRRQCSIKVGTGSLVGWWALRYTKIGKIVIGQNSIINCRIDFDSHNGCVQIGDRCYIGSSHLVCHTGITLEDDVIISWDVTIVDHDSHSVYLQNRLHDVSDWIQGKKCWDNVVIKPVHIEQGVWIGFGASILKGVTIGNGAVVAAQSVVTRNVPPFTVVAGNPARVVRELGDDER
jgi:acetyltransferase-like isoleucine patch superfamily enzyme